MLEQLSHHVLLLYMSSKLGRADINKHQRKLQERVTYENREDGREDQKKVHRCVPSLQTTTESAFTGDYHETNPMKFMVTVSSRSEATVQSPRVL